MKKTLLTSLFLTGIALAVPALAKAEGHLQNFKVSLCTKDGSKCLEIEGSEAKQSFLAPIYGFKNSQVRVIDHQSGTKKVIENASGHIDFENEQIVLIEKKNGHLTERSFTLASLNEQNFFVK